LADCAARFLTSLATTAKPLPCSPALAGLKNIKNNDKINLIGIHNVNEAIDLI